MTRFLRWFAVILAAFAVLGALAWWQRDVFFKAMATRALQRHTGMRVEMGTFQTSPAGAIAMRDVRFYNFPEFGGGVLLYAPELLVDLDRTLLAAGQVRFKELRVTLAELNVIQDTAGRWNFEKVEKEMTERNATRPQRGQPSFAFSGIDRLSLSLGRIRYSDLKRPGRNRDIQVGVTNEVASDIRTEEQLQEWIGSFLFRVILEDISLAPEKSRSKSKSKAKDALKDALER